MTPVDFLSPTWWVSVVLVSIIINLTSAYLKPPLDDFLGSLSSRWRDRVKTNRAKQEQLIRHYIANPILVSLLGTSSLWALLLSSVCFLISLILFTLIGIPAPVLTESVLFPPLSYKFSPRIVRLFASLCIISGMMILTRALRERALLVQIRLRLLKVV